MMKRVFLYAVLACLLLMQAACGNKARPSKQENVTGEPIVTEITEGVKFCESTLWNDSVLLITSFGGETLNPLNKDGKGYVMMYKDGKTSLLIAPGGILNAPKGMAVKGGYLFICDVNQMVVYNLNDLQAAPQKIVFPENDLFINDVKIQGDLLYVTVTNTGNIYTLNVSDPAGMLGQEPVLYTNIPGANGIELDSNIMYVASYPADGTTTDANVIYAINDINAPQPEKLITRTGQYDGLALSPDKSTLYFTSWVNGEVGKVNLATKEASLLVVPQMTGPADMAWHDGKLYIPDLPNSKVVVVVL